MNDTADVTDAPETTNTPDTTHAPETADTPETVEIDAGPPAESTRSEPVFSPPADIIETSDSVLILMDVPGADPDSLDVTLDNRVLSVSARASAGEPEGYTLVHAEYGQGNYARRFAVSEPIDAERIEARFKDGVLRLTLAKAAPSPAARIDVKSG